MLDRARVREKHGLRVLEWQGRSGIRILTEENMQALSDKDFASYARKFGLLKSYLNNVDPLTDPDTIRAFDFMRHAIRREQDRRKLDA
jgi:hypothetical protein